MTIRSAQPGDAAVLAAIYNHYVLTTFISFEDAPVSDVDMASRIADVQTGGLPWLVAEREGQVTGYAYATQWRTRPSYRFSVEVSVYIDSRETARGVGTRLYETLFASLREKSVHVVIAGIALPNEASAALHEKFGMRKVAHFTEVGFKLGAWRDVGYWQVVLAESACQQLPC